MLVNSQHYLGTSSPGHSLSSVSKSSDATRPIPLVPPPARLQINPQDVLLIAGSLLLLSLLHTFCQWCRQWWRVVIAFLCLSRCLRDCSFMSQPSIRGLLVVVGWGPMFTTDPSQMRAAQSIDRDMQLRVVTERLRVSPVTTVPLAANAFFLFCIGAAGQCSLLPFNRYLSM